MRHQLSGYHSSNCRSTSDESKTRMLPRHPCSRLLCLLFTLSVVSSTEYVIRGSNSHIPHDEHETFNNEEDWGATGINTWNADTDATKGDLSGAATEDVETWDNVKSLGGSEENVRSDTDGPQDATSWATNVAKRDFWGALNETEELNSYGLREDNATENTRDSGKPGERGKEEAGCICASGTNHWWWTEKSGKKYGKKEKSGKKKSGKKKSGKKKGKGGYYSDSSDDDGYYYDSDSDSYYGGGKKGGYGKGKGKGGKGGKGSAGGCDCSGLLPVSQIPSITPSVSAFPSASSAPSQTPSVSLMPSMSSAPSSAPTASASPTQKPSASSSPSASAAPTMTEKERNCQNYYDRGEFLNNTDVATHDAKVNVEIKRGMSDAKVQRIYKSINVVMWYYVGPMLLDCQAEDAKEETRLLLHVMLRQLEEESTITGVSFSNTQKNGDSSCTSSDSANQCIATKTPTEMAYDGDGSDLEGRLEKAVAEVHKMGLFNIEGVDKVSVGDPPTRVDDTADDTTTTTTDGNQDEAPVVAVTRGEHNNDKRQDGLIAVPIIIFVGLVVLAALIIKQRFSGRDKVSSDFVKYVDEEGELDEEATVESSAKAVIVSDDTTDTSADFAPPVISRDSSASTLGGVHSAMDVHVCQSSLCTVCEERKTHGGIKFLKTTDLPDAPPRLPSDIQRKYGAEDTIDL